MSCCMATKIIFLLFCVCADLMTYAQGSSPQTKTSLGQLLYINVDGYGNPQQDIDEAYFQLIGELQIGGVLPHFETRNMVAIRTAIWRLRQAVPQPLLIGIDHVKMAGPLNGEPGWVGLGFGAGLLGVYGTQLGDACLLELFVIQAFLHKALGLNQALGPTVDSCARFGFLNRNAQDVLPLANQLLAQLARFHLLATLKHYPYTPDSFSLHKQGLDVALSWEEVTNKTAIFRALAPQAEVLMTTHVFNSRIDAKAPVTFSKAWIKRLRDQDGFDGLVITDGLMMMRQYGYFSDHEDLLHLEGVPEITRRESIFAARAILAGHHMVILEGTAADTRSVHRDLSILLGHRSPTGREFALAVERANRAVAAFKLNHAALLREQIQVSPEVMQRALSLMNLILHSKEKVCGHRKAFRALSKHMSPQASNVTRILPAD